MADIRPLHEVEAFAQIDKEEIDPHPQPTKKSRLIMTSGPYRKLHPARRTRTRANKFQSETIDAGGASPYATVAFPDNICEFPMTNSPDPQPPETVQAPKR